MSLTARVLLLGGARNFSLLDRVQTRTEAHSVSYPMGIRSSSLVLKLPGNEADHSLLSTAEVKNGLHALVLH
jgi:hypothetical protein